MTTPTLSDLLQRLREEPELKVLIFDTRVWLENKYFKLEVSGVTYGDKLAVAKILCSRDNATRARLLAVVEALAMAAEGLSIWRQESPGMTLKNITAKLAAALENK